MLALILVGARSDGPASDWRLLFTGELRGYLEPCGCTAPQVGGLARQATFIRKYLSDPRAVPVSNGDLVSDLEPQSLLKTEIIAEYFKSLKYGAVNLGEQDYALGVDTLKLMTINYGTPFISGNVRDENGERPFPASVERTDVGGGKLLIIGAISPLFEDAIKSSCPGFQVLPVEDLLQEMKSAAKGKAAVLLFHGGKEGAIEAAKAAPWLKAIVYAHASDKWQEPIKIGTVMLVAAGERGKEVGELKIAQDGITANHVELGPTFADDEKTASIRDYYSLRLREGDYLKTHPKIKEPASATYVGSNECASCHQKEQDIWKASPHSHAYATLTKVKMDYNPECVGCHSVGFAYKSGFSTPVATPHLRDVGCENCHGPGSEHVAYYKAKKDGGATPMQYPSMKANGEKACIGCHNPENSPNFMYDKYWPKIKH